MSRVTLRLGSDLFEKAEQLAETDRFDSRSDVVRAAIREFDPKPQGSDAETGEEAEEIIVAGDDGEILDEEVA